MAEHDLRLNRLLQRTADDAAAAEESKRVRAAALEEADAIGAERALFEARAGPEASALREKEAAAAAKVGAGEGVEAEAAAGLERLAAEKEALLRRLKHGKALREGKRRRRLARAHAAEAEEAAAALETRAVEARAGFVPALEQAKVAEAGGQAEAWAAQIEVTDARAGLR